MEILRKKEEGQIATTHSKVNLSEKSLEVSTIVTWYSVAMIHAIWFLRIKVGSISFNRCLHLRITSRIMVFVIHAEQERVWCFEGKSKCLR